MPGQNPQPLSESETESAESRGADEQHEGGQEEAADAQSLPDWAVRRLQEASEQQSEVPQESATEATSGDSRLDLPPEPADASVRDISQQLHESAPNLELMLDLPLDVTVELGRAELPLAQVLALRPGAVIQLDRLPGEPLDLLVNGQLVARGEIVVLNDTFAFRITDLMDT